MNFKEIYNECNNTLENHIMESLIFYFTEYPTQRKEFAKNFKQAFCALVDDVVTNLEEEEEPEDEDYDDYKEDYDINFEWDSTDLEEGYDPYLGCYTDDC